LWSDSGESGVN